MRAFTPTTSSTSSRKSDTTKKKEFRDKLLSSPALKEIESIRALTRKGPLSLVITFYLYGQTDVEGRKKKDLDNMLKIVLDILPEYIDNNKKETGLGLIESNKDELLFNIEATKKFVNDPVQEGVDLELFEWLDSKI